MGFINDEKKDSCYGIGWDLGREVFRIVSCVYMVLVVVFVKWGLIRRISV